jgi:hypothetical protein
VSEGLLARSRQLSAVTGWALPSWSAGPKQGDDLFAAATDAGYEGIQVFVPDQAEAARTAGLDRVSAISPARTADEAEGLLAMWADGGAESLTLHLGTGFETRDEALALVESVLKASDRHGVPVLVETHRATLFQDPARALELLGTFPELRFTADLSHWYTGVELVYGDLEAKLAALEPVFARCRMVHGRISDPGCIQVAVDGPDDPAPHVEHFRRMWTSVLAGATASGELDVLPFVVELLPASSGYARTVDRGDGPQEEVDRWTQADVLWELFAGLALPS